MKPILPPRRAFALVLVLIVIVLATTMAVFFLSSMGQERRGVDLYARGVQVRHFSGMTINRVIGQINAATKEGTATAPISWASQPGMVRTYQAGGNPSNVYKLYSWNTDPVTAGGSFNALSASELPPSGWAASPAIFTDLNQPINGVYPIVDPDAEGEVEGFSIDAGASAVSGSGSDAPMPVKWLYVLEDGQMVAPSNFTGTTATVPGASSANPIVGRVAFWTDDETAKVNVNTASEGAFWDWPKAATHDEMQFAGNPPIGGEFNRVSGHPAMTSLSAVFPELAPGDRWADVSGYRAKLKTLLDLTPRVPYSEESSRGGTYPIETASFTYGPNGTLPAIPSVPLALKTDRLFVSPDEVHFGPTDRTESADITVDRLKKRSFFLTASSRAPETTLFETPRVSLWPITWSYPTAHAKLSNRQTAAVTSPNPNATLLSDNAWMRAEERLLAFTSTLNAQRADGGDKYYFQRQNSESPTHDYANITRNQQLLSYLRRETSQEAPGYAGSFESKFTPAARDTILANTFNVIRSLVNQYTFSNDGKLLYSYTPVSFARFTRTNGTVAAQIESGAFSPIPLKLNLGSGEIATLNEFPLLREAGLVFYATNRVLPEKKPDSTLNFNDPLSWNNLINVNGTPGYPAGSRTTKMRAMMILDFFSLRGSTRNNQPVFWVKLSGGDLRANGASLGFGSAVAKLDYRAVGNIGRKMPSYMLPFYVKDASGNITDVKTLNNGNVDDQNYGLISSEISLNADGSDLEFDFSGGPITVEIYGIKDGDPSIDPTSDASLRVATYTVDFSSWDGKLKVPLAPRWNYFDQLNRVKDPATVVVGGTTVTNWKGSMCPNPGFDAASNWAAIEIGPAYRTSTAASDPVMGGNSSVPGWTSLFKKLPDSEGSIDYPPTSGSSSFIYRAPPTYAFCDEAGENAGRIMTDYRKRLLFYPNAPCTIYSKAENSGIELTTAGSGSPGTPFNPGGFPSATVYDTVVSVTPDPAGPGQGDPRLAANFTFKAIKDVIGSSTKMKQVLLSQFGNPTKQYHTFGAANNFPAGTGYIAPATYTVLGSGIAPGGMAITGNDSSNGILGRASGETDTNTMDGAVVGVNSMRPIETIGSNASAGDWASGAGYTKDGGLLPRPDQDFQSLYATGGGSATSFSYTTPYFVTNNSASDGANTPSSKGYFSPNRQIPSPISLLGSLPTSLTEGWQSLLFSPNPSAGSTHPGLSGLPDYLFLDLFWMPVAEPYPISEEFSTAGKINLNYRIMPFAYINRRTGLHALLKSTWITALNNSLASYYKSHDKVKGMASSQTRYAIDPAETLELFDREVLNSGDIFRSAAQICSIWLVPRGRTADNVEAFWNDKLLTSDTAREQPYDHLYSRVTTKSNTYTVHWKAQALRKVPGTDPGVWDENRDRLGAELRGSTLIERYLDPNATHIPDYATDASAEPLSHFYKWRTVSENFFHP